MPAAVTVPPELAEAADRLGVSRRLAEVLVARGCTAPADLEAFVGAPLDGLHDPARLPDANVLRARLAAGRAQGERVMVFGDFDADGLSGLAILVLALRAFGVDVEPYVPSRFTEGHGLSVAAVDRAVESGCGVIVTVDCGTSSPDEIALAASRRIDVIVTDHHHVPERDPGALALVNPHRPDAAYPDTRLTGAGVAFKVAELLLGRADALGLADLATIGTIADVAPLLGENRAIVRLGLDLLRSEPRPGLAALMAAAGIAASRVDADAIAYDIAPRLNAAGRIGEAGLAARLLLAADPADAGALAAQLEEANRTRRDLTASAVAEARDAVGDPGDAPAIIVAGAWPVGLVGLVAARLAEDHGRPVVVFSTLADPWRGSARSGGGTLDLARAFGACAPHMARFGGHAAAAGCDLPPHRFEAFRADFLALAAQAAPSPGRELRVDMAVPVADVGYSLYRELAVLEPVGPGNPAPQVAVLGAAVTRARAVSNGHGQLTISKGREVLDVIAFGRADLADVVTAGDRVDLVARLASRTYGGYESLQLELLDVAPSGLVPMPVIAAGDA
jgi:single-stranded-DNA-specific exonuclease